MKAYKEGRKKGFMKGNIPWNKDKKHSEESKKKISNTLTGKKLSEETKRKISKSLKKRYLTKRKNNEFQQ